MFGVERLARRSKTLLRNASKVGALVLLCIGFFLMQWFWYPVALIALTILVFYFATLNDKARKQKLHRRQVAQIKHIDKMSGSEFEQHLADYFARCGYKIELTPASGDFGADLVLRSKNECIVVQAKRWNSKIGVSAVQEISTARHFYGASSALLITNSSLTKSAHELARRANVCVWERSVLFENLYK
ncbi:hypothetical protein BH10CYA1_BH10CYA1_40160 [soil metagenome]